jgi:DNA-binding transcriptional regulator YhcF (GntR family)
MLQTPDVFTYDLQELNNSLSFIVSLSNKSGKHVKVAKSGALAVFTSMKSLEAYKQISNVVTDSKPYEVSFEEMKDIASKEADGLYQILD